MADLHLYRLPGQITLPDQRTRQVTLLQVPALPVEQANTSARRRVTPTAPDRRAATAASAGPAEASRNGAAAAASRCRPASSASSPAPATAASARLIGEDRIEHTPEGGRVTLTPGEAFDITVLRRQTDFKTERLAGEGQRERLDDRRDKRQDAAMIRLVEVIPGDWTILAESAPHEKETANRLVWRLQVPANGVAQLTYRVRVQQ